MVKTEVLTASFFDLLSWYLTAKSSTPTQNLFPFKTKQNTKQHNNNKKSKPQTKAQTILTSEEDLYMSIFIAMRVVNL